MRFTHSLALLVRQSCLLFSMLACLLLFGMQALPASAESPSFVRIIHASPDVGTSDIFVDGTKVLSSMPFAGITDYVQLPAGPHKVQVALIGKGPGAAVITQTLSVQPGVAYTVAALGTNATGFSLNAFIDDNLISSGMAKLRVYQLSPGTSSINVAQSGNTVVNGLAYPQASNYFTFTPNSYTFNVTSVQPNTTMPVAANLKMNTVTSIFAVGVINGSPKLQLVSSQVNGLPGMPGTGSDPHALTRSSTHSQPLLPTTFWLLGVLALASTGAGMTVRKLSTARRKTIARTRL